MAAAPRLGFITHAQRTQAQWDAHAAAEAGMHKQLALPTPTLAKGEAVRLFDFWSRPEVVADVGFPFPRFHQLTGSCVGAGGGQALFTLIAVQRCLSQGATRAFLPFWPFDYGRCRANEGDRGQGEGAMGSSFADTVVKEGVIAATGPDADPDLPAFTNSDGLTLTERLEMQWSDGASQLVTAHLTSARKHPVGSAAPCRSSQDIKAALLNGYPCTFACDDYVGHGSVQGSGGNACVVGRYDGSGGHQQSVHGYWEHPDLGPLYLWLNNWPGSTYPTLPTQPVCSVWQKEADVDRAFQRLHVECYAVSHLSWFEAQPALLDWMP